MPEIKTPDKIIEQISPYYKKRVGLFKAKAIDEVASEEYKLVYDSSSETLEPVYFWILDFIGKTSSEVEKLVDNFTSTTGSGHFSELMGKGTRMQEEAMKIYGMVNTVIKSILNLVYDLKEFKLRLKSYDDAKSKSPEIAQAGMLSLKQIWMDTVDIKKGVGSINQMTQQLNFVTLRDAFLSSDSLKKIDQLDLNDRVKRVLKARLHEFFEWKDRSEQELRKRYEIEKTYLKTQVNTVKLYSRWAKPYLIAAEQLRMKEQGRWEPHLVNAFNTISLELTLLGKSKINIADEAANHNLPEEFAKMKFKRDYYKCVLIDFKFRGIPGKVGQQGHYAFGGKVDVTFRGYILNEDELKAMKYELEQSDFEGSLKLVEGMTTESLDQLKEDIDEFLSEKPSEAEEQERIKQQDVNPFAALIGLGAKKPAKKPEEPEDEKEYAKQLVKKGVKQDTFAESVVRALGDKDIQQKCFKAYDIYKKAHGMASTPDRV